MRNGLATLVAFLGGFAVMVLEIIGARYLAKDFGSSFYVWVSQIGVVLTALALGYAVGGVLADRTKRRYFLALMLLGSAAATYFIPNYASHLIEAIIMRHPADEPIPSLWQKLDPMLGSALIFLLPCFVLATIAPYMVRLAARKLAHVGRISGLIYAASTVGSIAGVFVSGFVLIDHMNLTTIFRWIGGLTLMLAGLCAMIDRWLAETPPSL